MKWQNPMEWTIDRVARGRVFNGSPFGIRQRNPHNIRECVKEFICKHRIIITLMLKETHNGLAAKAVERMAKWERVYSHKTARHDLCCNLGTFYYVLKYHRL